MGAAIDLDASREILDASTDFTVGIEEEFAILDAATLDMVPRFEELKEAGAKDDVLADAIAGELIRSEIEIRSGRGEDPADALARQRVARRRLFALATQHGIALGATGTHPWADYREQEFIDTEHYRRVSEGLQYAAKRNNTFGLHVHVGVGGADRAIRTCDRLRSVLPLLLAVSANSPYVDGRDSGLHSARTEVFTRTFPRCGVPDAYGSWTAFADYIDFLVRVNSIQEYTQVWWSVRPHLSFGTVELRMCDAQTTAAESDALIALHVACIAQAARDEEEGVPFEDPAHRLIEENVWRAIRYGLDGRFVDLARAEEFEGAEVLERLLTWTAPVRAELGLEPAFGELNGAQRQRRMIEAGVGMDEVYAAAVRDTRETYAQEVIA
jgi:glutamate---cysteine ligase / carboxylate-amine ligase